MDNRHSTVDKPWTAYGQQDCPHPAHTLPTAPAYSRLPTSSTASTAAAEIPSHIYIYIGT